MTADLLYLTADNVGTATGGGAVTYHESTALGELGNLRLWAFPRAVRPWGADAVASERLRADPTYRPALAHCYAGCFTDTIKLLRERGTKVTYTAAAHDINVSRREHEQLGLPFDHPHLTNPTLWARYIEGYRLADTVICPSTYSAAIMRSYGCGDVAVIPHGVDLPAAVPPLPSRFSVLCLTRAGADKGHRYLLDAWSRLAYPDVLLTIAGYGTEALVGLVRAQARGAVYLAGTAADPGLHYAAASILVAPSATEGFGISVLEAMAHGRPAICTDGTGARDVASCVVSACDPVALAEGIDLYRRTSNLAEHGDKARQLAERCAWPRIRAVYRRRWEAML